jgi:hypothetical protein
MEYRQQKKILILFLYNYKKRKKKRVKIAIKPSSGIQFDSTIPSSPSSRARNCHWKKRTKYSRLFNIPWSDKAFQLTENLFLFSDQNIYT